MRPLLTLLLVSCAAWAGGLAQAPAPPPDGPLAPGQNNSSLIALDFADAKDGGLALACAYIGPLEGQSFEGVLAAATLENLSPLLEAALAIFKVATTPADRAEASAELKLGRCTLTLTE